MSEERPMFQLPMGDLWRPPVQDENGENVQRPDTVSTQHLAQRPKAGADVAAILMAELEKGKTVPVMGQ